MEEKSRLKALFFGVLCFLVGTGLAVQAQMPKGLKLFVSAQSVADMEVQIETENTNLAQILASIEDTEKRLLEYQELLGEAEQDNLLGEKKKEVDYYKLVSGSVAAKGPGVTVTIDDETRDLREWEDINDIIVHDNDILVILNDLFTAGAEAVSVNGHRITSTSAVTCAGYTVRVNGYFEARPFVIQAIGNPSRLSNALLATGSNGDFLKDFVKFQVKVEDELLLPGFTEDRTYQYMSITKEGETN